MLGRLRMYAVLSAVAMVLLIPAAPAMAGNNGEIGKYAYWSVKKAPCALGFKSYC